MTLPDNSALIHKTSETNGGITFLDAAAGKAVLKIEVIDTKTAAFGKYYFDLILVDENSKPMTVATGEFEIIASVTENNA